MSKIMSFRLNELNSSIEGIDNTGVFGISGNPENYHIAGISDNPGLYIFGQILHYLFNLNSNQILDIYYFFFIGLGFLFYVLGIFLFTKITHVRIVSILAVVFLTKFIVDIKDLYIMSYFSASFILLLLSTLKLKNIKIILFIFFIVGFILSISNITRMHSATPVLIFFITFLLFQIQNIYKKSLIIMFFLGGFYSFNLLFNSTIIETRNNFLSELNSRNTLESQHPFWHSIYIGLGYINNNTVAKYRDEIGFEKAKSINPEVIIYSKEYEDILKKETLKFIYENTNFFFYQLSVKIGIIITLMFTFMGLFGIYFLRSASYKDFIPFFMSISFSILPGIMVIPVLQYLTGFISMVIVGLIFYMNKFFQNNFIHVNNYINFNSFFIFGTFLSFLLTYIFSYAYILNTYHIFTYVAYIINKILN